MDILHLAAPCRNVPVTFTLDIRQMPAILERLPVPFCDDAIQVATVQWTLGRPTLVEVKSRLTGRRCELKFEDDTGLRILGELDLAATWMAQPKGLMQSTWLFVVRSGGWFDLEATREDFYTKHEEPVTEYLVVGFQQCVSVLSRSKPEVVEARGPDA